GLALTSEVQTLLEELGGRYGGSIGDGGGGGTGAPRRRSRRPSGAPPISYSRQIQKRTVRSL
ncbi:MAG: hypothetical protein ACHQQP_07480, partial [Gemmatimonadales bacterium]